MSLLLPQYLRATWSLSNDELQAVLHFFQPEQLAKGDYFLKAGHYADKLAFVESGLLREYLQTEVQEVTKWIVTPGYFAVDLSSFLFHQPARVFLQALTDCQLFYIDKKDYDRIGQVAPNWPELEKRFIAKCFTVLEDRVVMHLALTAEQRFEAFYRQAPELFQLVPQQYLASLLGMRPETFSRIRNQQRKKSS